MSVYVGGMLLSSKRYCSEVFPKMEVWSYEDLAYASFGVLGRVSCLEGGGVVYASFGVLGRVSCLEGWGCGLCMSWAE